jgi:DNA replication protein DnaC
MTRRGGYDLEKALRRLHLPTIRRLYTPLAEEAEKDGWTFREYLEHLISEEIAHRAETRITRSTRKAKFPFLKTIDEFDFAFQQSVKKKALGRFFGPELVEEGRSLILLGKPGRGKTHLAIAMAYKAIQNGYEAFFTTAAALLNQLHRGATAGELDETLAPYVEPHVLVIDELGYLSYGPDAANLLFQVVDQRYLTKRPMVFTSNKEPEEWGAVLHDPDLAEAIVDRVLERGEKLHLKGKSYRNPGGH